MRLVVAILALMTVTAQGQSASGFHLWKSGDIAAKGKSLSQKLDPQKVASEVVATEGNRKFMVAHREGSGLAEWHEKEADVMFISAGNDPMYHQRHDGATAFTNNAISYAASGTTNLGALLKAKLDQK